MKTGSEDSKVHFRIKRLFKIIPEVKKSNTNAWSFFARFARMEIADKQTRPWGMVPLLTARLSYDIKPSCHVSDVTPRIMKRGRRLDAYFRTKKQED